MDDLYSKTLSEQINNLLEIEERKEKIREEKEIQRKGFKSLMPKKRIEARVEVQQVIKEEVIETPRPKNNIDVASDVISFISKSDKQEEIREVTPDLVLDEKINLLQKQIFQISTSLGGLREATLVSGIGQGGDGQTPGSGEVLLARLDDVDLDLENLSDGDTLIWDSSTGTFVGGAGGSGGGGAVSKIIAGTGIDIDPAGGIGNVEISTDLAVEDLGNIVGGPATNGDLLVYNGSNWAIGTLNTAQLTLTNPSTFNVPTFQNRVTAIGPYSTQEDANNIFADLIDEINLRVDELENASTPGTFLGLIDATDAVNEPPDTNVLNSGDYYIHEGASGDLWGDATKGTVEDGNQIIWDGINWKVVSTVSTLAQLGDTDTDGAAAGDFLVYDGATDKWTTQTVPIPKVTIGTTPPNSGQEEDGDFYFDQDNEVLYIYDSIWTEVSGGGGASVAVQSDPPADAKEGDLFVEDDQYTLYVFHDSNWIGLTNDGLSAGGGDGGSTPTEDYLPLTGGEIDGELTITSLANVGVGSVGVDASGKLIVLDESVLPSITINYYEYMYRSLSPAADADLTDSELIFYQINFENDDDHAVSVLHEIDKDGDGNWADANTLKTSLGIMNVAATQVVFYGPKHSSSASDTATDFPNLKVRSTLTSGSGASQVIEMTPEVDLFDGDPKKVELNIRSTGAEDINGYVDNSTFEYAVSQVGKRIQTIVAESSDFADFQTRIAAINF